MIRLISFVLLCGLLISCSRPLTPPEAAFSQVIHGDALDRSRVRLHKGALVGSVTFRRKARPRVTCRERIWPAPTEEIVTTSPAAVALFNRIFFTDDWYLDDYTPEYPQTLPLVQAMLLAHELTHVWQWQNRDITGYSPLRAATEHTQSDDPYLFDLQNKARFLDYGYEQQGAIVEEYVCCRALAPEAARTRRLHAMLSEVMPVSALPEAREWDVILPWKDAELGGICG